MPALQTKECPSCGGDVKCTMSSYCWCFNIEIPENVQDYIAALYDDCICENCLRNLIEEYGSSKFMSNRQ